MNRLDQKHHQALQRKHRVRSRVIGTNKMPRLSVYISNHHLTAQIIDDSEQKTLIYATTIGNKKIGDGSMIEKAAKVGEEIATKAKASKITRVVFDRGARLYHGRIKALAEAARNQGLEF